MNSMRVGFGFKAWCAATRNDRALAATTGLVRNGVGLGPSSCVADLTAAELTGLELALLFAFRRGAAAEVVDAAPDAEAAATAGVGILTAAVVDAATEGEEIDPKLSTTGRSPALIVAVDATPAVAAAAAAPAVPAEPGADPADGVAELAGTSVDDPPCNIRAIVTREAILGARLRGPITNGLRPRLLASTVRGRGLFKMLLEPVRKELVTADATEGRTRFREITPDAVLDWDVAADADPVATGGAGTPDEVLLLAAACRLAEAVTLGAGGTESVLSTIAGRGCDTRDGAPMRAKPFAGTGFVDRLARGVADRGRFRARFTTGGSETSPSCRCCLAGMISRLG